MPSARFRDCTHPFQLCERFRGAFLRGQFHGLAIFGFALPPDGRQLAGLEIGMLFQNPQRIATRNRSVLAGIAGQNNARIACGRSNSRFMSSIPTAPASSNTINCRSVRTGFDQQQALQRLRLESFFA